MKIVCVKTPKFLRPFFKLFARKKKRVDCVGKTDTANVQQVPDEEKSAEESKCPIKTELRRASERRVDAPTP